MILKYFHDFFVHFREEKKAFIKFGCLSIIAGCLELFGVALTYPFTLKILSKNNTITGNYDIFFIGISIVLLFLLKNIFMIYYVHLQALYTNKFEAKIKIKLIEFFLNSTYQVTSKIPLALRNKIFSFLIPTVINEFIFRLLNICVNIFVFLLISLCLLIKFPIATFCAIFSAIILITAQTYIYKPFVKNISEKLNLLSLKEYQNYNEILIDLKSIKVSNNEKCFYNKIKTIIADYHKNYSQISFFKIVPPYITEPFIILVLFVLLAIISYQNINSTDKLISSFALIATAIFRLAPTISRLQVNINGINSTLPVITEFLSIYDTYKVADTIPITNKKFQEFNQSIELKNVSFAYDETPILNNINLKINKGEYIGIAGLSGAGKTTLADIIAGLYIPNKGEILIDDKPLKNSLKIGYIPQEFMLITGTIRENIAFGNNEIDDDRVIQALKQAQLYDFINKTCPKGIYEAPFTDSDGLSQGQKQRLAIARALYTNPDILIMDEATSSLDLKTEDKICEILENLKGDKTIIVIAHRLSTLKPADRIIFIKNGEITGNANFEELIKINPDFQELAMLSELKNKII
mgnify:CR=1 FL=1